MERAGVPDGQIERGERGRFAKGRSGNPGGRKPVPPEVRQAVPPRTAAAVAVLVEVLNSPSATLPMRSMAALGILCAAGGHQTVSASLPVGKALASHRPPSNASELRALAVEALRAVASDENAPASARAKALGQIRKYCSTARK